MRPIGRRDFIAGAAGAVAWPLAARAQQPALPVVGYLSPTTGNSRAFHQGLGEFGYVEGRNVEILFRQAQGHYDLLPALADDLVRRAVTVIFAAGAGAALAASSRVRSRPTFRSCSRPSSS